MATALNWRDAHLVAGALTKAQNRALRSQSVIIVSAPSIRVETLDPAAPSLPLPALIAAMADIHIACIEGPDQMIATFTPPLDRARIEAFWQGVLRDAASPTRDRVVFLAFAEEQRLAGYVMLYRPQWQTGPFRGSVEKLIVSPDFRRLGIARRLVDALEKEAKVLGQTLLLLDTETGSPAEIVYPKLGYNLLGIVPNYGISPGDKSLKDGTFFWKQL